MNAIYFIFFDPSTGIGTGGGITPDGTIPTGATVCSQDQAENPHGWMLQDGTIVAAPAVPPSLASQASTALAAGVTVTFATSTTLDGLYACDESTNNKMIAQIVSIQKNGTFTNGQTTRAWPATVDGRVTLLTFDIPQFEALATAIGLYVDQLDQIILTNAGTLPAASLTVQA